MTAGAMPPIVSRAFGGSETASAGTTRRNVLPENSVTSNPSAGWGLLSSIFSVSFIIKSIAGRPHSNNMMQRRTARQSRFDRDAVAANHATVGALLGGHPSLYLLGTQCGPFSPSDHWGLVLTKRSTARAHSPQSSDLKGLCRSKGNLKDPRITTTETSVLDRLDRGLVGIERTRVVSIRFSARPRLDPSAFPAEGAESKILALVDRQNQINLWPRHEHCCREIRVEGRH